MSPRKLSVTFVTISGLLLASCSVVPPQPAASVPYFVEGRSVTVDRHYVKRYACATGKPLVCRALTRLGNLECSC
jgi:hypothetical protein